MIRPLAEKDYNIAIDIVNTNWKKTYSDYVNPLLLNEDGCKKRAEELKHDFQSRRLLEYVWEEQGQILALLSIGDTADTVSYTHLYENILNNAVLFKYTPCLVHNDFSANNMIFRNNRLFGVIDFGDFNVGDPDNDFLCLLDCSTDDFGKEFGRKVLKYYQHKAPEVAERKAELNDVYWLIDQIIYGYERKDREMSVSYTHLRICFPSMTRSTKTTEKRKVWSTRKSCCRPMPRQNTPTGNSSGTH